MRFFRLLTSTLITLALLAACSYPDLPGAPKLPRPPSPRSLPGVDELLDQLPGFDLDLLRELGLPDLSEIADLPQLGDLPGLPVPENAIAFAGPTEMRIEVGDFIRGTEIQLTGIVDGRRQLSLRRPARRTHRRRLTRLRRSLAQHQQCRLYAASARLSGGGKGTSARPAFIAS